ncbi:MAG: DNA-processing protein DprA [Chloroflexota bacterium]
MTQPTPMSIDPKAYWVAMNLVPGIGPARLTALVEACGSVEAAWKAPIQQLKEAGLDRRSQESLLEMRRQIQPQHEWVRIQQHRAGIDVLTWEDAAYPENLRLIDNAPPVLYVRGQLLEQDQWAVAIVGTRRATAYGREVAHTLATQLAKNGITVVSGLALGIDGIAHKAALDAGGRTIAVLGSGVDQLYPAANRGLAERILQEGAGAVISDYAVGTQPIAHNFRPRNRIISGLGRGTIVVEAGMDSGSLSTANFAAEQSREVFAVPGSILSPNSKGCNYLIQQGAHPLLTIEDVLESLNLTRIHEQHDVRQTIPMTEPEQQLLTYLSKEPQHIDDLIRHASMNPAQISSLLAMMELKGLVRQVGTMNYVRA